MVAIVPVATALYAGLLGLFALVLAVLVIRGRRRHRVGIGDGGRQDLARSIRAFGNFIEYVPLILGLLMLLEMLGTPRLLVHLGGVTLLAGRMAHARAFTLSSGDSAGRVGGMALTFTALVGASAGLLFMAIRNGAVG